MQDGFGVMDYLDLLHESDYGVLGNWINWLVYNMERSCNNAVFDQKIIGIEQVAQVLPTISRLNGWITTLVKTNKGD